MKRNTQKSGGTAMNPAKRKKNGRRVLSIIFMLTLVLSMLAGTGLVALAAESTTDSPQIILNNVAKVNDDGAVGGYSYTANLINGGEIETLLVSVDSGYFALPSLADGITIIAQNYGSLNTAAFSVTDVSEEALEAFLSGIIFYPEQDTPMNITVQVSNYPSNLPDGATISQYEIDGVTHYYSFVTVEDMTWKEAYNTAKTLSYAGLKGYLATILSAGEESILDNLTEDMGWAGGSRYIAEIQDQDDISGIEIPDNVLNDDGNLVGFYWVCGPEAGTAIYDMYTNTDATTYSNWNVNANTGVSEPNNSSGHEQSLNIHYVGTGKWNDEKWYQTDIDIMGYFVEFSPYVNETTGTNGYVNSEDAYTLNISTDVDVIFGDGFIADHLTGDDGTVYKEATAENYADILGGEDDWNAKTQAEKDAINATLTANGGQTYEELLSAAKIYETADQFIADHLTGDDGAIYKEATAENYADILGGEDDWNAKTQEEKDAINAILTANGGQTYEELLAAAKIYETADQFIADHLTGDDGAIYKEATAENYEDILNAEDDWNAKTQAEKDAINAILTANGGQTYEELLAAAKAYAASLTGTPKTGDSALLFFWLSLALLSLLGITTTALYRKTR